AWAHLMVSTTTTHTARRATLEHLQTLVNNPTTTPETLLYITTLGRNGLGAILEKQGQVPTRPNPAILTTLPATAAAAAETSSAWGDDAQKLVYEFSTRVFNSIQSLVPSSNVSHYTPDVMSTILMNLLVLCTHPVVDATVGSDAWIRVCWRAGVDPLQVVERLGATKIAGWMASTADVDPTLGGFQLRADEGGFQKATLNAVTLLVGISANVVMSACMPGVIASLDNSVVSGVGLVDVEVWKGVEGVAVCDVYGKLKVVKVEEEEDLRGKTEEEKWEIQLKKELQAKKGATAAPAAAAKGKAPEKGKPVNAKAAAAAKAEKEAERVQLEKESATRKRVQAIYERVSTALDILQAVLEGVASALDEEAREAFEMWMARCMESVLKVVERESVVIRRGKKGKRGPVLVGKKAIDVFRLISKATEDRIWRIVEMGWDIATLRLMGVEISATGIPEDLCKKDLSVVLTKLLMAAKSDYVASNPLSPGAFAYIFPLLSFLILRTGRTRNIKEKIRTELIIFASEILIAHC
ncbi:hypothetical protein HDU99_006219, partial [Rhizoclosmatium hyalinum]